jgi:hypothetical protein
MCDHGTRNLISMLVKDRYILMRKCQELEKASSYASNDRSMNVLLLWFLSVAQSASF